MAADFANSKRLVTYSPRADQDFVDNYNYTAFHWGREQAERYARMLRLTAEEAACHPKRGKRIKGHPRVRSVFVKWPKARHGHYICYRETADGIHVLHILHSASDLPGRLGEPV